jgi:crossover junction endodeoxyribonuclease RuvC
VSPLLALDLGTRCGWALWDGARLESGVQVFDLKRGESPGMRFVRFNAWLASWAPDTPRPALIAYEQTHHRGGAATEVAAGLATRVQEFCARHGVEHVAVHSATLKKWATGKGNADKAGMLAAVCRRWKPVTDDNETDAVALLQYALRELMPPEALAL